MPSTADPSGLPSRFEGPRDSPGFLLWQTTNAWQRHLRDALAPLDLTHVQFVLLASVAWLTGRHDRDALTQRALAAHTRMDEMMTSQTLRTLERKGLVQRAAHPTDRRARQLRATAAGRALAAQAIVVVEDADAAFFAALGTEAASFGRGLKRLADQ